MIPLLVGGLVVLMALVLVALALVGVVINRQRKQLASQGSDIAKAQAQIEAARVSALSFAGTLDVVNAFAGDVKKLKGDVSMISMRVAMPEGQ